MAFYTNSINDSTIVNMGQKRTRVWWNKTIILFFLRT